MMDEDFVERRPADLEIYRRLDAFAQVRLAPDAAAMARIRTALMGQALALADARSAALTSPAPLPVALPERPAIAFPRPQRRAAAAVLAACLVVGVGAGSVAASQAGGPLYGPRMWIEAATLPSDPMARANAQLGRLDARLQEVRVAVGERQRRSRRSGARSLCRHRGGPRRPGLREQRRRGLARGRHGPPPGRPDRAAGRGPGPGPGRHPARAPAGRERHRRDRRRSAPRQTGRREPVARAARVKGAAARVAAVRVRAGTGQGVGGAGPGRRRG